MWRILGVCTMLRSVTKATVFAIVFAIFVLAQMATATAQTWRPHLTFNVASYHLGATRDFNEVNPGFGFGVTGPSPIDAFELGLEAGNYKNSLDNQSYYIMGSLDTEVAQLSKNIAVRLGGFAGFSRYPTGANKFKDHGVPTIGDWVMAAGLQSTLRISDDYDVRLRVMPAGNVADALFTLQLAVRF